ARCALSCSFFKLVSPAAVIRHRLTAELCLIFELRIVDENDDDLTLYAILEIVPLVLGRDHTVTAEDEIRIRRNGVFRLLRPGHEFVTIFQSSRAAHSR